jgi:hypothetical protein
MRKENKTYNIGDSIYCDKCECQRRIDKIEEIVGYINGNGYYIKYFPCKCGNNITLETPKFIHKLP